MELLNKLYKLNRTLVGDGFDKALQIIKEELPEMKILEFPTGKEYGTWKIPQKWEVKDAWVKYKGKKIIDYKKEPLSLVVGSLPVNKKIDLDELKRHLFYEPKKGNAIPYVFNYYEEDWGFCTTRQKFDKLKKGEYEVFADTEYTDGTLKVGEYIIKGKLDREILIAAHLDHPFQANDNLSGVITAVNLAKSLKCDHTIRIIFTPETIGAMAYAYTQDLSKIDFGIALDMVGNDANPIVQRSFFDNDDISKAGTMALSKFSKEYQSGPFRGPLGADEYIFNDPQIKIPMIFFSRSLYYEYHTNLDTPEIVKPERIKEMEGIVKQTIKIMETNWTPKRLFKGPLMRSRYDVQQLTKEDNRKYDYFFYFMDGNRSLIELCYICKLDYDKMNELLNKMKKDGFIESVSKNIQKDK